MTSTNERGFTIVELLIVIVVIGILAAITIVAFTGIQERAHTTTIQSNLSAAAKKLQLYQLETSNGSYPTSMAMVETALTGVFSKNSYHWVIYCTNTTGYILAAKRPAVAEWYIVGSSQNLIETTTPGTSGNSTTTCSNLGFSSPTFADWIKSNAGWKF